MTRDFSTVYTFTNRLTDDDLQAITQLANENGFAGFTVSGDFQSLEYFTVRKYNPNYGEESDKIIDFESDNIIKVHTPVHQKHYDRSNKHYNEEY